MTPAWRERTIIAATGCIAVWLAFELASGAYFWPVLIGTLAGLAVLHYAIKVSLDVAILGILLMGYILGNRGFAQLQALPGLPLFPGELGLACMGGWLFVKSAYAKNLPWQRDGLNYAVAAWIVLGTGRVICDFPHYGFVALRDYAMTYYAAFFFIAQNITREKRERTFVQDCLLAACTALPAVFVLADTFPAFFLHDLTVKGVPLVYFKGDLVLAFLAVASFTLALVAPRSHRVWTWPLATLLLLWVFAADNRASMLGSLVALFWISLSRFRAFAWLQLGAVAAVFATLIGLSVLVENDWAQRRVHATVDRVVSVIDVAGKFEYSSEESLSKSGNTRFRWVWWRSVATETMHTNPLFGLGFGYDLAQGFLQEYNPEMADDFTARSPHNIAVTTLGRLGLAGLGVFVWTVAALTRRTWQAMRDPNADSDTVGLWVTLWPILVSACLGVVLEGPMGAVVFWSLAGLANSSLSRTESEKTAESATAPLPAGSAGV